VRNIRHHCAVLSAAALLAACASGAKGGVSSALEAEPISVSVTNQNWLDVDVFVVHGGSRYRIGEVGGNTSATLSIPSSLIVHGEIQLMADPVGSDDRYTTGTISVMPDQRLQLTVAPRMRMSSYAVWARR
jgi:hypothetical protein